MEVPAAWMTILSGVTGLALHVVRLHVYGWVALGMCVILLFITLRLPDSKKEHEHEQVHAKQQ